MQKLKLLIVEDMPNSLQMLETNLKAFSDIIDLKNIKKATSYSKALLIIANGNTFDISILDLLLGDGKECLDLIKDSNNQKAFGSIILKTSSKKNIQRIKAASSFEGVYDLEQDYYPNSLSKVFADILNDRKKIEANKKGDEGHKFILAYEATIQNGDPILINPLNIVYIKTFDNYTFFFHQTESGKVDKAMILNQLNVYVEKLDPAIFQQIDRGLVVNMNFVGSYKKQCITLKFESTIHNPGILKVTDSHKQSFESRFIK